MKLARVSALALFVLALPTFGAAQIPSTDIRLITIRSKGDDVRTVLANIFEQAKEQYVLPANFRFALYMSLDNCPFDKALDIVCKQTGLEAVREDSVYHVRVAPKPTIPAAQPTGTPSTAPATTTATTKVAPSTGPSTGAKVGGSPVPPPPTPTIRPTERPIPVRRFTLGAEVLTRRVTTRLQRADIRDVFDAIGKQANLTIEVSDEVPAYKLDAFLIKTSLKYSLDKITNAAGLEYRFSDHGTILITKAAAGK